MKKLDPSKLNPLSVYALYMQRCGVWSIARHMDKAGLDISVALRAARIARPVLPDGTSISVF